MQCVLPKNWSYRVSDQMPIIFDLNFEPKHRLMWPGESNDIGDVLILNLASRKQFWTWKILIENQSKAKVTGDDGDPYDFDDNEFWEVQDSMTSEMKAGTQQIDIKYVVFIKARQQGITG